MHMISLKEWSAEQIQEVLAFALKYKKEHEKYLEVFKGKTLLMIFEKTSTRTRISFESGFSKLGGHPIYLNMGVSNLVLSEIKDEIRYITRNVDIIMARMLKHEDLLTMAEYASVPVINGCCNLYHPCQIFSDLLTLKEEFDTLEGLTVTYVGIRNNICNELITGLTKSKIHFYQVTPLQKDDKIIKEIDEQAKASGYLIQTNNLEEAIRNSDVVYTDTWIDMEYFNNPDYANEKSMIMKKMLPYQLNSQLLSLNPKIKIMHDMPIHEGYEITREVIEDKNSIIFKQAENRMWLQNALMMKLLNVY